MTTGANPRDADTHLGPAIGRLAGKVLLCFGVLFALMVGLGLLVTHVLAHVAPLSSEDAVNRTLASDRTPTGNELTGIATSVANTSSIIAIMIVVAIIFRLVFQRWRESLFLVLAVSGQALVFMLTTLVISRKRPGVPHLDASPPTSSFPSGHTGAATALFVGIAVVLAWHVRRRWLRGLLVALLLLVPVAVAGSRLYRGMHHPSDVAGAYINGGLSVLVGARLVLFAVLPDRLTRVLDRPDAHKHRPPAGVAPTTRSVTT